MITNEKMLWSFIKFSQLNLKEMYCDHCGELVYSRLSLYGHLCKTDT